MQRLKQQKGFTLIELLVVVAIIGIIAAIAIPALLRARMVSNEVSAIGSMRAINTGQMGYAAACAGGWYATQLPTLGVPPPGGNQAFLSSELILSPAPQKSGFTYSLVPGAGAIVGPGDCNGTPTTSAYYSTAVAISPSISGNRAFASNTGGAIWQNVAGAGAAAPAEPFLVTATVYPVQ